MNALVEQLTRTVAQRTSRRGFLARMGNPAQGCQLKKRLDVFPIPQSSRNF
jgi:hypothetical protein